MDNDPIKAIWDGQETTIEYRFIRDLSTVHGLNGNQVTLLIATLHRIYTDDNQIPLHELAIVTNQSQAAVKRNMSVLVNKGLLKRWIPEKTIERVACYATGDFLNKLFNEVY